MKWADRLTVSKGQSLAFGSRNVTLKETKDTDRKLNTYTPA